jgi:hypothetical protein
MRGIAGWRAAETLETFGCLVAAMQQRRATETDSRE